MPIQFALRRTQAGTQPQPQEYLWLIADQLSTSSAENLINPTLPGNDSQSTAGRGGNNFSLSIGMHKFNIQAKGVFIDLKSIHFPQSLPGNAYDGTTTSSGTVRTCTYLPGGTTTPPNESAALLQNRPTAKVMRSMFVNFFADQINYTDHCILYPKWLDDGIKDPFPDGVYIPGGSIGETYTAGSSVGYRIWRGHISQFTTPEVAPEVKQYPWNLTFSVGQPL